MKFKGKYFIVILVLLGGITLFLMYNKSETLELDGFVFPSTHEKIHDSIPIEGSITLTYNFKDKDMNNDNIEVIYEDTMISEKLLFKEEDKNRLYFSILHLDNENDNDTIAGHGVILKDSGRCLISLPYHNIDLVSSSHDYPVSEEMYKSLFSENF